MFYQVLIYAPNFRCIRAFRERKHPCTDVQKVALDCIELHGSAWPLKRSHVSGNGEIGTECVLCVPQV